MKHVESTQTRHAEITHHEIWCATAISRGLKTLDELFAVAAFVDFESLAAQRHPQHAAHRSIVVRKKYKNRGCHRYVSVAIRKHCSCQSLDLTENFLFTDTLAGASRDRHWAGARREAKRPSRGTAPQLKPLGTVVAVLEES